MPVFSVLFLGLWTLLVVRLLAARATLRLRTVLAFLALGALIGPPSQLAVARFLDAYGSFGASLERALLVTLASHFLLLLPVFTYFFARGVYRVTSVADAFLLGFATGFGYDLASAAFTSAFIQQPIRVLTTFPPFALEAGEALVAGYGYWCALGALALAVGLRFLRRPRPAYAIAAGVVAFFAIEHVALGAAPDSALRWLTVLTLHGTLTPYLALVAVVACSFFEYRWVHKHASDSSPQRLQVLTEWQAILNAVLARRLDEAHRLATHLRLERNAEIARAEIAAGASDPALDRAAHYFASKLTATATPRRGSVADLAALALAWARAHAVQLAVTLLLLLAATVFPRFPDLQKWFWTSAIFQTVLPGLGLTTLNTALVVLIVWRYLAAPQRPFSTFDPDEVLDCNSETATVKAALGLALMAVFFGPLEQLYNFHGLLPLAGMWPPNVGGQVMATWVLLLAAFLTGVVLRRNDRWRAAPLALRRAAAVHNALLLMTSSVLIWSSFTFFSQAQAWIHRSYGPWLFNNFQARGNSVGDTLIAILSGAFAFGVAKGLFALSRRAENFLTVEPPAAAAAAPPRKAAAGAGR